MRALVVGAGGQLGAELVRAAAAAGDDVRGLTRADLDVTAPEAIDAVIRDSGAEVVINAAAYTAVDRAESDAALCETVNALAPGWMAAAAAAIGARFVHVSTDYVFDGSATSPIPEDAPTGPLGVYGQTKLAGEEAVHAAHPGAVVMRTAWVYGLDGANFVRTVLRVTRERGEMRVVDDQRGAPSWARDLAGAALQLGRRGAQGTFHVTNSGECSWFDLAAAVVELAGIDSVITPIPTDQYPTPARRPAYSVLDNRRWRELGEPPLRPWREALEEFMSLLLEAEARS